MALFLNSWHSWTLEPFSKNASLQSRCKKTSQRLTVQTCAGKTVCITAYIPSKALDCRRLQDCCFSPFSDRTGVLVSQLRFVWKLGKWGWSLRQATLCAFLSARRYPWTRKQNKLGKSIGPGFILFKWVLAFVKMPLIERLHTSFMWGRNLLPVGACIATLISLQEGLWDAAGKEQLFVGDS